MEAELFDGTVLEFPDGTSPDVISRVAREQTALKRGAPGADTPGPAAPPALKATTGNIAPERSALGSTASYLADTAAIGTREARRGLSMIAGAPVDLVNNAPRALNLLPGVDGIGPIAQKPFGGSQSIDDILGTLALGHEGPKPQDAFQRTVGRVGQELGASAVPAGAALRTAQVLGREGVKQLGPLARFFVEPFSVAPMRAAVNEGVMAGGAGLGAGMANELAGNPQHGDNFASDFTGSLLGVGGTAAAKGAVGAVATRMLPAMFGSPRFLNDVAGQEVASRLIAASSDMGQQAAERGTLDTTPLVQALRRPSAVEEAVPGYRGDIADRTQDPALATFAYGQNQRDARFANSRITGNEEAITSRVEGLDPGGDPAAFREALETNRTQQLAAAAAETERLRQIATQAEQQTQPVLRLAENRGENLRGALQDRYTAEQDRVRELFAPINEAAVPVDVAPLADRFQATTGALPLNTRQRFLPAEANVPEQLVQPEVPPTPSAILGPDGQPVMRPGTPATGEVPLSEVASIRSGLTDDIRAANATPGQAQRSRVAQQFRRETDDFLEEAVPPELREVYDTARAARRDVGDRFERKGDAVADVLRRKEGGDYQIQNSNVTRRFTPDDQGRVGDFQALMREAGGDDRARQAITDELLTDVQSRGLIERPQALRDYLAQRNVVLSQFPNVRERLTNLAASREALAAGEQTAADTQRRLTTPSQSAQANYLKYDNEATVNAVKSLVSGPRPREAARELVEAAGNSPEALQNARSAFWEAVKEKKFQAPDIKGGERWNAGKLKKMFDDPKTSAVADELWRDNPEHLADIRQVFDALASSGGTNRARLPGTSGTGQGVMGKFDSSLTAASVASRFRSVNRGVLSPQIAMVDLAATWLRSRSARLQSQAIDEIASKVVNDPDMAAELLVRFNPADYAARRRQIQQKFGVRATQVLNWLDEAKSDEDGTALPEVLVPRRGGR